MDFDYDPFKVIVSQAVAFKAQAQNMQGLFFHDRLIHFCATQFNYKVTVKILMGFWVHVGAFWGIWGYF